MNSFPFSEMRHLVGKDYHRVEVLDSCADICFRSVKDPQIYTEFSGFIDIVFFQPVDASDQRNVGSIPPLVNRGSSAYQMLFPFHYISTFQSFQKCAVQILTLQSNKKPTGGIIKFPASGFFVTLVYVLLKKST